MSEFGIGEQAAARALSKAAQEDDPARRISDDTLRAVVTLAWKNQFAADSRSNPRRMLAQILEPDVRAAIARDAK
jgi:hypothetical protein